LYLIMYGKIRIPSKLAVNVKEYTGREAIQNGAWKLLKSFLSRENAT